MLKRKLIVRTAAVIATMAVLIIGEGICKPQSWARPKFDDTRHLRVLPTRPPLRVTPWRPRIEVVTPKKGNSLNELIEDVWQTVNFAYIDPTFNKQNWNAVRQQYLNRDYASREEAYKAIREMLELLGDPLTRFIDPEVFKELFNQNQTASGVEIPLIQDKKTKELVVVNPIEAAPAFTAGVLPGDVLVKIDGQSIQGMNEAEVNPRLRGQPGTTVILGVQRDQKELEFRITRTPLEIRPVHYRHNKVSRGTIGYIRLREFSSDAAAQMRQAIQDLERQQVSGYVLDLRNNSGGLISSVTDVAQMWLQEGTIVSNVDRQGEVESAKANRLALTNKPLVILVNEGTASGGEILAAALQENQRAILVGTKTSGYNFIQSVRPLGDGSGLAVTIAKWHTPKGRDINNLGLTPDVIVNLTNAQQQAMIQEGTAGTLADPQYAKAMERLTN